MDQFQTFLIKDAFAGADEHFERPDKMLLRITSKTIDALLAAHAAFSVAKTALGNNHLTPLNSIEISMAKLNCIELCQDLDGPVCGIDEELMQAACHFENEKEYIERDIQPWDGRWNTPHVVVTDEHLEFGCYEKYNNFRIYSEPMPLSELQTIMAQRVAFEASRAIGDAFKEQDSQNASPSTPPSKRASLGL